MCSLDLAETWLGATTLAAGTKTADALLLTEKAEEITAVSLLCGSFCELAALMFITPLMVWRSKG
jgi:hypothetical protein